MTGRDEMSIEERWKYLRKMKKRYQAAGRAERSRLLDEMEAVTGQHRKHLIRQMGSQLERRPRQKQRGKVYGPEVKAVVRRVAESVDWVCAERLKGNLPWLATHLEQHGELVLSEPVRKQLETLSVSTLRRLLGRVEAVPGRLTRGKSRSQRSLARTVPIRRIPWDEARPGHFEADLVHHGGPSSSGEYGHSLQLVDVATGWSERVAILGRSYRVMQDGFERIEARLPFPVEEVHFDNGPEFLNAHLLRYFGRRFQGADLSRSRPYHKNDNRFVEQKNRTLVRAYLGDSRLDTVAQVLLLNQLYDRLWLFNNAFQPVLRLQAKTFFTDERGQHHLRRRFDTPATPLDRLFASAILDPAQAASLIALRSRTNPLALKTEIDTLLDRLAWETPARAGVSQDVHLTLFSSQKGAVTPVAFSSDRTTALR